MTYTFTGVDASLEISLLENGLIVSTEPHEDGSGTHFCVYKQGDKFGTCHISEKEIDNLLTGKDWATEEQLKRFYNYIGESPDTYLTRNLVSKLNDLIDYYGTANIMGTDYNPITEKEAKQFYLNK